MKQYEYKLSKHPAEQFSNLVYFCSDEGECSIKQIPMDQTKVFLDLLNDKGSEGWELVQALFGKDGVVLIWKRQM